jgi:hypothetical protein
MVEVGPGSSGDVAIFSSATTNIVVDVEGYVSQTTSGESGAGLYSPLPSPIRICDTRAGNPSDLETPNNQCNGSAQNLGRRLSAGGHISIQVTGDNNIPSGATSAVLNVTAVNPSSAGFLTVFPQGGSRPNTSNVNYSTGHNTNNRVILPLSAGGGISVYSSSSTDVVVDISGYFSASGGSGSAFTAAASPIRICDTRAGNPSGLSGSYGQCDARSLGSAQSLTINVRGLAGVPANAKAVVVNLTGISSNTNTFVTAFPGPRLPFTSDLNLTAGATRANLAVVALSAGGTITIYNNSGTTNAVVDVLGWYS